MDKYSLDIQDDIKQQKTITADEDDTTKMEQFMDEIDSAIITEDDAYLAFEKMLRLKKKNRK